MTRPYSDLRRRIYGESTRFVVECADCRDDAGNEKYWAQTCMDCAQALMKKHRNDHPGHRVRLIGAR